MKINCSRKLIFVILLVLLSAAFAPPIVGAFQADAASAISSAQSMIVTCYGAAKDAESAGANITALQNTLNAAGSLLSLAELSYSTSDFDAATNFAVQSQRPLDNFVHEASAMKETAAQQRSQDFLINVVGSIVGTVVVLAAGAVIWIFWKRKYEKTMDELN